MSRRYEQSRLRRFYPKLLSKTAEKHVAAVNVVDKETDGDVSGQQTVTFPSEFPAGEELQDQGAGPELLEHGRTRSFDAQRGPKKPKIVTPSGQEILPPDEDLPETPEEYSLIQTAHPWREAGIVYFKDGVRIYKGIGSDKWIWVTPHGTFTSDSAGIGLKPEYLGYLDAAWDPYAAEHAREMTREEVIDFESIYTNSGAPLTSEQMLEVDSHFPKHQASVSAEIGLGLSDLTTEKEHGKVRTKFDNASQWNESYHNDNQFEDADLKLGESESNNDDANPVADPVYAPYTDGIGQPNPRYEDADQNQHNIVVHAADDQENSPNRGPSRLWICVDLDGTILSKPETYQTESGDHVFGDPLPGSVDALRQLVDGGARVSIYTARQFFANSPEEVVKLREQLENWLIEHDIAFSDIYVGRKPPAHHFVDDRSIPPFDGDWNLVLDAVEDFMQPKTANDPIKDSKNYHGIKVDIEWPKGSVRSYKGENSYVTLMKCDYGYAHGIEGADGEELDIYLSDGDSDTAYIIEQVKEDGSYDEDKVMLGFNSKDEAVDMYLEHMPSYMLGEVREAPVNKLHNALYGEPVDSRTAFNLGNAVRKLVERKYPADSGLEPPEWTNKYTATDIFEPKIKKKPKSDYVGPQTSQVGGIGGPTGDKDAGVIIDWPNDENTWTDPTEDREDRSISRSAILKIASYADIATRALEKIDMSPLAKLICSRVDISKPYTSVVDDMVRVMITDDGFKQQVEAIVGPMPESRRQEIDDFMKQLTEQRQQERGPHDTGKVVNAFIIAMGDPL